MTANPTQSNEISDIVTTSLEVLLADIYQLYVKTLAYHWNVEDPRFSQLHEFFEEQYTQLAENLDEVAERIRKLGKKAPGSLKELIKLKRLDDTADVETGDQMITVLFKDYQSLIVCLKNDIDQADEQNDPGTADMLTAMLRQFEKTAWMLRSHLSR